MFFQTSCLKIKKHLDLPKLMTWDDSHWCAVQLQPNFRLPGRHSKGHCSHKDWENMTWIGSLFFPHIMTHIYVQLVLSLLQHMTINQCYQKIYNLEHTDTRLHKKRDLHYTAPYLFVKTRYMYAVSYEAWPNPSLLRNFFSINLEIFQGKVRRGQSQIQTVWGTFLA